jgi:hypothetical protein
VQLGLASRGVRSCGSYQFFGRDYQATYPTTPYLTGMKRKTANIDVRVEPQLIDKIDAWRAQQRVPPSRSAAIVYMLEYFLQHDGSERSSTPSSQEYA